MLLVALLTAGCSLVGGGAPFVLIFRGSYTVTVTVCSVVSSQVYAFCSARL
jgi:hypothetical protein